MLSGRVQYSVWALIGGRLSQPKRQEAAKVSLKLRGKLLSTHPSESLLEPPGELCSLDRPAATGHLPNLGPQHRGAQATGYLLRAVTGQAVYMSVCVGAAVCACHRCRRVLGGVPCACTLKRLCIAVASVHGWVRCNLFSGCAVRAALTLAPFPSRAALSSPELFFCKGYLAWKGYLALFLKVLWEFGLGVALHDPSSPVLPLSFPNGNWNCGAATVSEPVRGQLRECFWVSGTLCHK